MSGSETDNREKISGVLHFAQELLSARVRVILNMRDPQLGFFPEWELKDLPGVALGPDEETWLKVDRLRETSSPPPPESLVEWIEGRIDDPDQELSLKVSIVRYAELEEVIRLRFEGALELVDIQGSDSPDGTADGDRCDGATVQLWQERFPNLAKDFAAWRDGPRNRWAKEERIRRRSIDLYNQLFRIHNMLHGGAAATPPELVWGMGIARWKMPTVAVDIPIFEQLVDLELAKGGAILIRPRDVPATLSLRAFMELDIAGSFETQRDLQATFATMMGDEEAFMSPFEPRAWEPLLDRAANRLSAKARHVTRSELESGAKVEAPAENLVIYSNWAIYGRPRSENVREQDLERLRQKIEKLRQEGDVPPSLAGFVTPPQSEPAAQTNNWGLGRTDFGSNGAMAGGDDWGDGSRSGSAPDTPDGEAIGAKHFMFPLPHNEEQAKIVEMLEEHHVVTVTGPPGTGKTHSIANIIAHYMATGRRVLVTARTAEAISAVREKLVPSGLADLVIASVSSDREGTRQLEQAIQKLSNEVVGLSVEKTQEEIERLQAEIVVAEKNITRCDDELAEIAAVNLSPLIWQGEKRSALELSEILARSQEQHSWMTDRPTQPPPAEFDSVLKRLREALPSIAPDLEYLGAELPDPSTLPSAGVLIAAHQTEHAYRNRPIENFSGEPTMAVNSASSQARARELFDYFNSVSDFLRLAPEWARTQALHTVQAAATGAPLPAFHLDVQTWLQAVDSRQPGTVVYDASEVELNDLLAAATRGVAGRNPLGLGASVFASALTRAVRSIQLEGASPDSKEDWQQVFEALKVEESRRTFVAQWATYGQSGVLPPLPTGAVDVQCTLRDCFRVSTAVRHLATNITTTIRELEDFFPFGLDVRASISALDVARLTRALKANLPDTYQSPQEIGQLNAVAGDNRQPIFSLLRSLAEMIGADDADPNKILAVRNEVTNELGRLGKVRATLAQVAADLEAMRTAGAVQWADSCASNPVDAPKILRQDWRAAWDWAMMRGRLDRIVARGNGDQIRARRVQLKSRHEKLFQQLIRERTLLGLRGRITPKISTALATFTTAIRRLGRGTGKGAFRWRRAVRTSAMDAASAAPVWIMPEHKIAEQLAPELEDFDLVILDEASQSDITAIGALARGRKHLIVGDEKQVSPTAVGIADAKVSMLRAQYLPKLANKDVIDQNTSIFEIAHQMHPQTHVILREHFRCVEPIIQFSTRFYSGRLVPLRIPRPSERFDPPLVDVHVQGATRSGKINRAEARFIVDEIAAIAHDPNHKGRDVAVISLLGAEQADFVHRMLMADPRVGTDVMERLNLVCGDSRTMQGQERSVVFLSMVATKDDAVMQRDAPTEQRYNVALSRAKDRLYLVHSVEMADLKRGDLKLDALEHFRKPMPEGRQITGTGVLERCDSEFEREVCRLLLNANYRVRSQVKVGPYSIDLVVEGADDKRLAIELDGDRWHGPERWAQDMSRQAALERAGWTFWRVFGSQWYHEPDHWLRNLKETLTVMGISPIGAKATNDIFTEFRTPDYSVGFAESESQVADEAILELATPTSERKEEHPIVQ